MTQEEIKEVIKLTLDELASRDQLRKPDYRERLMEVGKRLYAYFNGTKDEDIRKALIQLSDDTYIDLIYLIYRDGKTQEWIAECFERDARTIRRNKRRLLIKISELIEL